MFLHLPVQEVIEEQHGEDRELRVNRQAWEPAHAGMVRDKEQRACADTEHSVPLHAPLQVSSGRIERRAARRQHQWNHG